MRNLMDVLLMSEIHLLPENVSLQKYFNVIKKDNSGLRNSLNHVLLA
jgi:hypothetical protein